jgi:hypothetical protein
MRRPKVSLTQVTSWTMLGIGAVALLLSIIYVSSILAFAGLGLLFWGALLLYAKNQEYIQKDLLEASVLPSLVTLNQMLQELDYEGQPTYLPPKYFEAPEATKIYVSEQKDAPAPTPEQIQKYEDRFLVRNSKGILGILLTPPGAGLTKLFEKALETSFTKVDLEYLQQKMPKIFIEDLEIADNLEIEKTENDKIHVKIVNPVCKDLCKNVSNLSHICGSIGCPICSSIACAIAKASGKLVTIERTESTEDGKTLTADYKIIE